MVATTVRRQAYIGVLVAFFLWGAAFISRAQPAASQGRIISEGILHYSVSLETAESAAKKILDSTYQTIYLKGNLVRIEFSNPLRTQITLFRAGTASGGVYKMSGSETYFTPLDSAAYAAYHHPFVPAVLQSTGDTATINGFFCHKFEGTTLTGKAITIWVHSALTLFNSQFHPFFNRVNGLPVQYSYPSGNDKAVFTLKKVEIIPITQNIFEVNAQNVRTIEFRKN
jgi:hypothetical protein